MRALVSMSVASLIGLGVLTAAAPTAPRAQAIIGASVRFAPPPLPVYEQPPIPGYGYIWTPGYWAWSDYDNDYFWVPGCWVEPPAPFLLWTPGYWGWDDGIFTFSPGYWGRHVGFYGGISYGFGYTGSGYIGGYWNGDRFFYNRDLNNFGDRRISTFYSSPVIGRARLGGASFNGGPGGTRARPNSADLTAARESHVPATAGQLQQRHLASTLPGLRASLNHGKPSIAATARPAVLRGPGVIAASRAAIYRPPPPMAVQEFAKGTTRHAAFVGPIRGRREPPTHPTSPQPAHRYDGARAMDRWPTISARAYQRGPFGDYHPAHANPPPRTFAAPRPFEAPRAPNPPPIPSRPPPRGEGHEGPRR